jgi:hypothetical protein
MLCLRGYYLRATEIFKLPEMRYELFLSILTKQIHMFMVVVSHSYANALLILKADLVGYK